MHTFRSLPLAQIDPQPRNPNRLPPARVAALRASMLENGCLEPVVVVPYGSRFRVVGGHHRCDVARDLGWSEIPAIVAHLTPAQERKALLALNKIRGDAQIEIVTEILRGFTEEDLVLPADLAATGYSEREIEALTAQLGDEIDGIERDAMQVTTPEATEAALFTLEIEFTDRASYRKARAALRKAAGGKGGSLAVGLLRVLEIEEGDPS